MTRKREAISIWEWVAAALSAGMVLTAAGALVVHGWRERTPPDLRVSVESVEQVRSGSLVRFHVLNEGGRTAAGVRIRGVLSAAGQERRARRFWTTSPVAPSEGAGCFSPAIPVRATSACERWAIASPERGSRRTRLQPHLVTVGTTLQFTLPKQREISTTCESPEFLENA